MSSASAQNAAFQSSQRRVSQSQRTAEAKDAFTESLKSTGTQIDTELQERAKTIHMNDKALTRQQEEVEKETRKLERQTDSMQKFVTKSKHQLTTLDDLQPLHLGLEDDLDELEEMLDMIEHDDASREHVAPDSSR